MFRDTCAIGQEGDFFCLSENFLVVVVSPIEGVGGLGFWDCGRRVWGGDVSLSGAREARGPPVLHAFTR